MKKNLKKNGGFTGIDVSISMIIILIFIPTVFGVVYNIQKTNANIKRQSNAVSIASRILETVKTERYSDISVSESLLASDISRIYKSSEYKNTEKEENGYSYMYYSTTGDENEHYQIQVGIKNYYPTETENEDLVKLVKVRVFYPVGDKIKDIDISTVVQNS